jgi:polysaccharide pyruvyl transferase WcaK-like protein
MRIRPPTGRPTCLLVGYSGAGNTGADARLITIIDDVRAAFGGEVGITAVTLDRGQTLRALPAGAGVEVVQLPALFAGKLLQLVARHDVTVLVEGSTFKQNWSRWLLYAYLAAAGFARLTGRKCVAYAVDVGALTPLNRFLTARVCEGIDLLVTRTEVARNRLASMGVKRPIVANTDTAFRYLLDEPASPRSPGGRKTVGIAPIEFHHWPVKVRPFGRRRDCYRWPFHFTWTPERRRRSAATAEHFRNLVRHAIDNHELDVTLIAMESLDTAVCEAVRDGLPGRYRPHVRLASARELPPARMVPLLRGLDYLVTARYHACVLSMAGAVPQMAVCHDERLESIYRELGIDREFLLDHRDPELAEKLPATFDRLMRCAPEVAGVLRARHDGYYLPMCDKNRSDLAAWVRQAFPAAAEAPAGG